MAATNSVRPGGREEKRMAEWRTARPVSGEIMAARRNGAGQSLPLAGSDVVQAEFETVAIAATSSAALPSAARDGLAFLAAGTPAAAPFTKPGGTVFWTAGLMVVALAFWVSGGHALLHPRDAGAQPAALTLSGVVSRVDLSGPRPLLRVDGEAGNDGAARAELPPLEIRVAGLDGTVTRYKLGTVSRSLGPGERFAFSSRLDVPRNGVKSVSVTFAE
jgi:hypothetical protein